MRRYLYLVAAILLVARMVSGTPGQSPAAPAPQSAAKTAKIGEITVSGSKKVSTEQIITASGLKPGDVVTTQQLQGAADRLVALGLFSTVNYRFTTKGDAIALEFQLQDALTYPLSFDNFPWFTDDELAQAIRKETGLFTGEAPDSGAILDGISDAIGHLLDTQKIKGDVTHQLVAQPVSDGMEMQFRLDAPGLKIQSVEFGDPLAANSEQLKDRVSDLIGQPYSRFAIEVFENEQVRPLYAAKGYLRAKIGPPQTKLMLEPGDPTKDAVGISLPVVPGAVYAFNSISWQGNAAIGTPNLNGAVEIKSGDAVDGMKIEALWQSIQASYASHGYLDAKVDPQAQFDDAAHRVSYQVAIKEGPQYRMGQIIVTGLSVDAEKRLRQYWLLAPGQVFDNVYFEKVAKELAKPSVDIFGEMPIHYTEFGHWVRPDTEKHTVDVLLDFK